MEPRTIEFVTDRRFVRRRREWRTLETMMQMYCRHHHGGGGQCAECSELRDYARRRLERCVFGDAKPTCANCTVHCYTADMREKVRARMRWAGPRMPLRHPIVALLHVIDGWRPAPLLPGRAAARQRKTEPGQHREATIVARPEAARRLRDIRLSLRTKGVLAVSVVVVLVVLTGLFVANERQALVRIVQEVEHNQATQGMLAMVINQLARSMLGAPSTEAEAAWSHELRVSLERVREAIPPLEQEVRDLEALVAIPRERLAPAAQAELRDRDQQLIAKLHDLLKSLQARSRALADDYRKSQRAISVAIVTTHVTAVLGSLAAVFIFFTRIARDIKALQDRAIAIVGGYSGPPLSNSRGDEIGGLIDAVNRMQVDLRRSERQEEVTRQQRFHQEKMAAVGSVASAIGHEVSNPIAAIAGVAQFMVNETRAEETEKGRALHDFSGEILRQSQRITLILRQLGNLTTPPSPEPRLLDLNALIRSTCAFISYDKRFSGIDIEFDLDPALPAVTAVADHVTQVLMNLLLNAADAMDARDRPGASRIFISTRNPGGPVLVAIRDTGHGMTPEVLARAFQESFTTKPAGRGRGIGLFLCKTLVEEGGGRIVLESSPGEGTTATLFLPCGS